MISERKKFDQKDFLDSDPKSREVASRYFSQFGGKVYSNPNEFGIDLISDTQSDGTWLGIELERHPKFKGSDFPYSRVNLPLRKCKYFGVEPPLHKLKSNEYIDNNKNNYYVIINNEYTHYGIISAEKIRQFCREHEPEEVSNTVFAEGEFFYRIPKKLFKWCDFEI